MGRSGSDSDSDWGGPTPSQRGLEVLVAPRGLVLLLAVLFVANVTRSLVIGEAGQFPFNLMIGAAALLVGLGGGLTLSEMGLSRSSVARGLRYGAAAFWLISVAVVALGLFGALGDDRLDVSGPAMAMKVLVTIPIGTVLIEEIAFRGALDGFLRRRFGDRPSSVVVGAVLFGLWHLLPTWRGGGVETGTGAVETVIGTLVATTAFGAFLIWLRRRSDSLIAPMLAHFATNGVTFAVGWVLLRV